MIFTSISVYVSVVGCDGRVVGRGGRVDGISEVGLFELFVSEGESFHLFIHSSQLLP